MITVKDPFNFLTTYPMPAWAKDPVADLIHRSPTMELTLKKTAVVFQNHPLAILFKLAEAPKSDHNRLVQTLYSVPEKVRNDLFQQVYALADKIPNKGWGWGEQNALVDLDRLLKAIQKVAENIFDRLPQETKNAISGTIYRMANQPQTNDIEWGSKNVKTDTLRLIRALNRHQCLGFSGIEVPVFFELEKTLPQHERTLPFHLNRKELPRGQIGMLNGTGQNLQSARENVERISTNSAQGYNIHGIHSATVDKAWDYGSAYLGMQKTITPAVISLLDQWQDFFETNANDRFLQLCHSRGSIEVQNALMILPEELRKRIIVINLAPAYFIQPKDVYKVINLIIPRDPVAAIAINREALIDNPSCTWKLHEQNTDPHDFHGSSYRYELDRLIPQYIATNDITL